MLGINQTRVPIPLDCAESLPVYVNAKQFRAILRRRQIRAKLEAQKKILKARKVLLCMDIYIYMHVCMFTQKISNAFSSNIFGF